MAARFTRSSPVSCFAVLLVIADLFASGITSNPTAQPEEVFPETASIAWLKQHLGHERVFPINRRWSLFKAPAVVFPPDAATVYGIHDVQGYDSLFTRQYKAFADAFALPNPLGNRDASPPEVGNMLFFQNAADDLIAKTGAKYAISSGASQVAEPASMPKRTAEYTGADGLILSPLTSAGRATTAGKGGEPVPQPRWLEDSATRVVLAVSATTPRVLNLQDQFYPGWRVTVDGRAAILSRQTNAPVFRSVSLPGGNHRVEFRYDPASFRVGLFCACLGVMTLLAVFLLPQRDGERGQRTVP